MEVMARLDDGSSDTEHEEAEAVVVVETPQSLSEPSLLGVALSLVPSLVLEMKLRSSRFQAALKSEVSLKGKYPPAQQNQCSCFHSQHGFSRVVS